MYTQALRYLTGEANYGGRVTDAYDRRTLLCLLETVYDTAILQEGHALAPGGACNTSVCAPPEGPLEAYVDCICALPAATPPEMLGLHSNADITRGRQEAAQLLNGLFAACGAGAAANSSNSSGGGGGGSGGVGAASAARDALLLQLTRELSGKLRPAFDIQAASQQYPLDYKEALNTVLTQELMRFNALTATIQYSLTQLQHALCGADEAGRQKWGAGVGGGGSKPAAAGIQQSCSGRQPIPQACLA